MSSQSNTTPAGGGSSSSSSASSRSDEKQLFRHRARLFTMNTAGQWSELGTGDAKVSTVYSIIDTFHRIITTVMKKNIFVTTRNR